MFISAINPVQQGYNKNRVSNNNVAFNGMIKMFKNKIYLDGQKDIEEILKQHPDTNPIVGQLPNFIFKKLPLENKREAILEIMNTFDDVAFK